ncbi:MFS transporter [Providencia huashanensis]|uniref:MFS transporter n=1 Tax=Providencia huashanensis TaxID=3037798 RepID=UPI004045B192
MSSYFRFMSQEWPLLSFGFITVFIGNIGQSFFLSWYGADIQQSLNISAEDYGFIYAIATLCSSAVIFMVGGLVDRWALHKVVIVVSFLLCVSCLLMANIQTVWMLFFAFWGLRLAGQGLFPHTAQTTMLRVYTHQRGKALSLSASGVAFGEMVLPIILMTTIALLGWRWSWLMLALIVMIIYQWL